jgi:hypothetical protein
MVYSLTGFLLGLLIEAVPLMIFGCGRGSRDAGGPEAFEQGLVFLSECTKYPSFWILPPMVAVALGLGMAYVEYTSGAAVSFMFKESE